jgi:signal transduction histidine kinase/DNA-binding response OmpR family regulator
MNETNDSQIRILVVDDESIVLSLVRDALEDEHYLVETAVKAKDALAIVNAKRIDLIVTDIRMPDMSGIELVKKVRAVQPDVGVIFMTGYANLNSAKDAIKHGAFDYILKPFELDEIRRAVGGAVKRIQKEAAQKDPQQQLDRLSDLNQMLVAVGDRSTLSTVSLRFAMMHCQSDRGAVLFWGKGKERCRLLTIIEDRVDERELPYEPLEPSLGRLDASSFQEPVFVTHLEEHPLYTVNPDTRLAEYVVPPWMDDDLQMVTVPLNRANALLGLIMIGLPDTTSIVKGTDLKLLTICASQLALSLENLELLEETQQAYARLKEMQDQAIQLERMATKGEMSAEIGHELNNFLGVVTGNLSMLDHQLQKGNYPELSKYVGAMADNINKIETFTSNLMDLRRTASHKETIYFDQLLNDVIGYLTPQGRYRDVTINVHPVERPIPFEADSVHIQQLLYNLFNNAADATAGCERREITVRCTTSAESTTFSFVIADTGVGIDSQLLRKLFSERFTTKRSGHGFGLVVCKQIVDSHNGRITFDSQPGTGTTIRIDFPLATSQTEPAATV